MRSLLVLVVLVVGLVPCQAQNLLPNPEFDHNVEGWRPDLSWDSSQSAFGLGGSAVVSLQSGAVLGNSTSVCVPVTPGVAYAWGGQYRFPAAVDSQTVYFVVSFTTDAGCTHSIANTFLFSEDSSPGQWRTMSTAGTAPAGVTAALFVVEVEPTATREARVVNFDDVFFGPVGTVGPGQANEIPTLSAYGLFALALGLGFASLRVLRRNPRSIP